MDREKINKAAEEAAEKYINAADAFCYEVFDGFKQGTDWFMQQPLSDRLTDEEKEKIKEAYWDYNQIMGLPSGRAVCNVLTAIFGTDLFKEK